MKRDICSREDPVHAPKKREGQRGVVQGGHAAASLRTVEQARHCSEMSSSRGTDSHAWCEWAAIRAMRFLLDSIGISFDPNYGPKMSERECDEILLFMVCAVVPTR